MSKIIGIDLGTTFSAASIDSYSPMLGTVAGYTSGGLTTPPPIQSNIIDKFPFAADSNATDVGDLTVNKSAGAGQSSTSEGYVSGGLEGPTVVNTIEKFPFSTDANASDIADLSVARNYCEGQQD